MKKGEDAICFSWLSFIKKNIYVILTIFKAQTKQNSLTSKHYQWLIMFCDLIKPYEKLVPPIISMTQGCMQLIFFLFLCLLFVVGLLLSSKIYIMGYY